MAKPSDFSILVESVATYLHLPHDFHLLEIIEAFFAVSDSFERNAAFLVVELVCLIRNLHSSKSYQLNLGTREGSTQQPLREHDF